MSTLEKKKEKLQDLQRRYNTLRGAIQDLRHEIRREQYQPRLGACYVCRVEGDIHCEVYGRCIAINETENSVRLVTFMKHDISNYSVDVSWRHDLDDFEEVPFAQWAFAWEEFNNQMNKLITLEVKDES